MVRGMTPRPFFTRGPGLAFLRALIEEGAGLDWGRADIASTFKVVDQKCAELFPTENRGEWFSPVFLGGAGINHIPPHLVFAVYAIYADLLGGSPEPIPFLSAPLAMNATTAVQFEPPGDFFVESADRERAPMTDLLLVVPAKMSEQWSGEVYGIPRLRPEVVRVSWNAAAASLPTAIATGQVYLHPGSGTVLDPMAPAFDEAEDCLFFEEPALPSRLARYRERLVELSGTPLEVLQHNHENGRRVLEAYLKVAEPRPAP